MSFEQMEWTHAGFDMRLEPYTYGLVWSTPTIVGLVQVSTWKPHELERRRLGGRVIVGWPRELIDREFAMLLHRVPQSCNGAVSANRRWSVRFVTAGSANDPLSAVMRLNWLAEQLAEKKYDVFKEPHCD